MDVPVRRYLALKKPFCVMDALEGYRSELYRFVYISLPDDPLIYIGRVLNRASVSF